LDGGLRTYSEPVDNLGIANGGKGFGNPNAFCA